MKTPILIPLAFLVFLLAIAGYAGRSGRIQAENLDKYSAAVFAGGCFWCTEADFEKLPGVHQVVSGFSGGHVADPSYEQVSDGGTGHVESVKVYYDPAVISYSDLLDAFWRMIDPTDKAGQFVDRGAEYKSVIFYQTEQEKSQAENARQLLDASKRYVTPIVTEIRQLTHFYPAEDDHQDYYKKNPLRYKYYRTNSGRDTYMRKIWGTESQIKAKQGDSSGHYNKPADGVVNYLGSQ